MPTAAALIARAIILAAHDAVSTLTDGWTQADAVKKRISIIYRDQAGSWDLGAMNEQANREVAQISSL